MGFGDFFNSIKTGLGSAVDWVNRNSGTIGAVAGVIGKVAGAVILADDLDEFDSGDDVQNLQRNYNLATGYIQEQADKAVPTSSADNPDSTTKTNSGKLTGVWTSPSFLDANQNPAVNIVQDVSKFLHQQCMPTVWKGSDGKIKDLAQYISAGAFSDQKSQLAVADDHGVTTVPFEIQLAHGSYVRGAHAFYKLPLGQGLTDDGLHSCISLQVATTEPFRKSQAELRDSFHVSSPESLAVADGSGWLVTFKIVWTSTEFAIKLWKTISTLLAKPGNAYAVVYNTTQGNIQIVKISAPDGVSPAKTKSDLTNAISQALSEQSTPPMFFSLEIGSSNISTQLPIITLENSSLNLSSQAAPVKPSGQQAATPVGGSTRSSALADRNLPSRLR